MVFLIPFHQRENENQGQPVVNLFDRKLATVARGFSFLETSFRSMSVEVLTAVWQHAPYSGNTLLTLLALADWSNDKGESWPSVETLAVKSRQSERNCRYTIRKLETQNAISVTQRDDTSSLYRINLEALTRGAKISKKGGKMTQQGGQFATKTVSQIAPYTSLDTSIEPTPFCLTPPSAVDGDSKPLKTGIDIQKLFEYFCQSSGKSKTYTLTPKREKMAESRWKEVLKIANGDVAEAKVLVKHAIDAVVESKFMQDKGLVEWEQIFRSEDNFSKWLDRYDNEVA